MIKMSIIKAYRMEQTKSTHSRRFYRAMMLRIAWLCHMCLRLSVRR